MKRIPPEHRKGTCGLCGNDRKLAQGHVIPAFVERFQKKRSSTGYISEVRPGSKRRKQTLPRLYMFCQCCETLLSADETKFTKHVFSVDWKEGLSVFKTGT
jgi:hypothetical protein